MDDKVQSPISLAVRFGLIGGGAGIIFYLVLYLVNPEILAGFSTMAVYAIYIALVIFGLLEIRKPYEEFSFGNAMKFGLIIWVVGLIMLFLFSYILFNIVDPDLVDIVKNRSKEITESMMLRFGAPESEIDKALDQIEARDISSVSAYLKSMFGFVIFGLIVVSIVGLFVRKKVAEN